MITFIEILMIVLSGLARPLLMISDSRLGLIFKKLTGLLADEDYIEDVPTDLDLMINKLFERCQICTKTQPSAQTALYPYAAGRVACISALADEDAGWLARSLISSIFGEDSPEWPQPQQPQYLQISKHCNAVISDLKGNIPQKVLDMNDGIWRMAEEINQNEQLGLDTEELGRIVSAACVYEFSQDFPNRSADPVVLASVDIDQLAVIYAIDWIFHGEDMEAGSMSSYRAEAIEYFHDRPELEMEDTFDVRGTRKNQVTQEGPLRSERQTYQHTDAEMEEPVIFGSDADEE